MSLEFAIQFPCPVRRSLSEKRIRELGRLSSLTSRLILTTIETNSAPSEDAVRFLEQYAEPMSEVERIAPVCRSCPAYLPARLESTLQETIGCLGRIHYPWDEVFEHFLANRAQLFLDVMPEEDWPRILHVVLDRETPFDGERSKVLRQVTTSAGLRYFERRLPIPLSRRGAQINTDHLFDVLQGFHCEDQASHYTRELPVMALNDYGEFLEALLLRDLHAGEHAGMRGSSPTYHEFLRFGAAIVRAEELQVRILME